MSDGLHRLGLELTTQQERTLFKAIGDDSQGYFIMLFEKNAIGTESWCITLFKVVKSRLLLP